MHPRARHGLHASPPAAVHEYAHTALPTGFLMSVTSKPSLLEEGTHNAIGRETWRLLPPGRWHRCCRQSPSIVSPGGPGRAWGCGERPTGSRAGFRGCLLALLERGGECHLEGHPALLGLGWGAGSCPLTPREQGGHEFSG